MRSRKVIPQPIVVQAEMPRDHAPMPCLALTIEEAAEVLRVSRCTVLSLVEEKRLRKVTIGRRVIISIQAVDEFLNGSG